MIYRGKFGVNGWKSEIDCLEKYISNIFGGWKEVDSFFGGKRGIERNREILRT